MTSRRKWKSVSRLESQNARPMCLDCIFYREPLNSDRIRAVDKKRTLPRACAVNDGRHRSGVII